MINYEIVKYGYGKTEKSYLSKMKYYVMDLK